MRSKYAYRRPFCEVCGTIVPNVSRDGWWTCFEHFDAPKPDHPMFDSVTGEPIDPLTE